MPLTLFRRLFPLTVTLEFTPTPKSLATLTAEPAEVILLPLTLTLLSPPPTYIADEPPSPVILLPVIWAPLVLNRAINVPSAVPLLPETTMLELPSMTVMSALYIAGLAPLKLLLEKVTSCTGVLFAWKPSVELAVLLTTFLRKTVLLVVIEAARPGLLTMLFWIVSPVLAFCMTKAAVPE